MKKNKKLVSVVLGSMIAGSLATSIYASDMKCGANGKCGNSKKVRDNNETNASCDVNETKKQKCKECGDSKK